MLLNDVYWDEEDLPGHHWAPSQAPDERDYLGVFPRIESGEIVMYIGMHPKYIDLCQVLYKDQTYFVGLNYMLGSFEKF
jgi:hypothetical protein